MFALTQKLEQELGLQPEQVRLAVGTTLNFLSVATGTNVTQALHGIEDTRPLMQSSPTPRLSVGEAGSLAKQGGDTAADSGTDQLVPLLTTLSDQGLSPDKSLRMVGILLGFVRSKIGSATFESMLASVPALRSLEWSGESYIGTETLV